MSTITTTGYKLPTSIISNGQTTGNEWSNPNNALLVDGDVAVSNPNNTASDFILGNYNFNLPQDAVITGIEMKVIGYRGAQTSPVITLTPYAVDNTSGTDLFYPYVTPFTGLTETNAEYVLGSSTYLFATSWTPDQINNLKLQMIANGNISLDCVLVNVYYYIPDPITPPVVTGDSCTDCNSTIQAQTFYLARAFKAGDTKAYLKSFNYPDGTPIQYEDLGSCGGYLNFVFDQGKAKTDQSQNFEENARCAVWTVLPSGIVELDFVALTNRGRQFHTPNAHDADLLSDHDANSEVIISNNSDYENRRLQRCHIGSIVSAPIVVQDESVDIVNPASTLDFQGGGVSVAVDGTDPAKAIITIAGVGGTTPPGLDDESDATSGSTQVPTLTWNHTCSGVNRLLTVEVSMEAGKTVTGITYNGVAMTLVPTATASTGTVRTEIWKIVAPAVGTNAIVVTFSANSYCSAGAQSWVGVDQTTSTGTVQTGTGTSLTPSLVLATTYDNSIIVDGLSTAQTPILYTKGAGQSENWHRTANTDTRQGGGSYELSGSAPDNVTMSWAITQNTPWALVAVEIKGITSPTPVSSPITVEDEGVAVDTNVTNMDFVGAGVTVTQTSPGHVEIDIPGGGTGTGNALQETVTQTAHGFSTDDVLRSNGTDGEYTTAQADTPANADVVGFVVSVTNANEFVIGTGGFFNLTALPGGAVAGDNLWLDETTAGALSLTEPTTAGTVSQPLARVIDASTKLVFWNNWRGIENQATPISTGASAVFANGVDTVPMTNTTVTTITHNLGAIPSRIIINSISYVNNGTGQQGILNGNGFYDANGQSVVNMAVSPTAGQYPFSDASSVMAYGTSAGVSSSAAISNVTSTTFDITTTGTVANGIWVVNYAVESGGGNVLGEYTNGVTTKDTSAASVVQNIPHGLSAIPKKIKITFMAPAIGASGTNLYQAVLAYNGTTSSVVGRAFINGANRDMSGTDIILYGPTSGNQTEFQTGVVTFDATNIIITWTKTNSPTGIVGMMWEAEC